MCDQGRREELCVIKVIIEGVKLCLTKVGTILGRNEKSLMGGGGGLEGERLNV